MKIDIEDMVASPEMFFLLPEDVLNDCRLKAEEKKKILDSWAADKEALCRADAEKMLPKKADSSSPAEMLRRISIARASLEKRARWSFLFF